MTHDTNTDTDSIDPETPPVPRVVRGLLADYGREFGVSTPLLVAMTHVETDAAAWTIRATIERMERRGEVYDAAGDSDASAWKVTSA
jgi:hypothetical protein